MQIPTSTYRLQFNPAFGFKAAEAIIDYLSRLGVSHIYASPIFKPREGSAHGYDGVDPNALNRELGTPDEFNDLVGALKDRCMGWVQDIVPNHLAYDHDNALLMDVLENGPSSKFSSFFDIAWDHPDPDLNGRVLAPFLGDAPDACLKNREIRLRYDAGGFAFAYYNLTFPAAIPFYRPLLDRIAPGVKSGAGDDHPDHHRFIDILDDLESLAAGTGPATRHARVQTVKKALWALYADSKAVRSAIDDALARINGSDGHPSDLAFLGRLLDRQFFRLDHWQTACKRINYRRFFTINDLISLRQEEEAVFVHTHALIARLVDEAVVAGVRIDHVDGMADPARYLNQLRERMGDVYILVEKILDSDEPLPEDWPVQGTTGYEFTQALNGLFVLKDAEDRFTDIYTRFTGMAEGFDGIVAAGKRRILTDQMGGDLDNLVRAVEAASDRFPSPDDMTRDRFREALSELLVRFPVYRTYFTRENHGESSSPARKTDHSYFMAAAELAVLHRPGLRREIDFIRKMFLGEFAAEAPSPGAGDAALIQEAVQRFQQLTAPLMAKGFEDTALYVYNRLISLNSVGGDPSRFGIARNRFHDFIEKRAFRWPHAMNGTATHDGKRGEDIRARINVLSEIPDEWEKQLEAWHGINRDQKPELEGGGRARQAPNKNEEYLLYQTLLGAWESEDGAPSPDFLDRMKAYMVKAAREAKVNTAWLTTDESYEEALSEFVERILDPSPDNRFLESFHPFQQKIAYYGFFNTLSQTLIKIAAPGAPDFYQGTELLDLNLVDPDNRRPVDFDHRLRLLDRILAEVETAGEAPLRFISSFLETPRDGRAKLFLIARALKARNDRPTLFQNGDYLPLDVEGSLSRHIIAFARRLGGEWCMVVAPRFLTALVSETEMPLGPSVWGDTAIRLPEDRPAMWTNVLTGEEISGESRLSVGDILRHFSVGLLAG